MESQRLRFSGWIAFLIVLFSAAGARIWHIGNQASWAQTSGNERVQGCDPKKRDQLVENLKRHRWFGSFAPLSDVEERTAHIAPGYPWLLSLVAQWTDDWKPVVRWMQTGLGACTAGIYFLFARLAFRSLLVGALTGLFCAFYPFWIINCAEICDGTLTCFLMGACLLLGMHAGRAGGPTASLLFGVCLAALALVRAAMLPFAVVTMLWFLLRCRWLTRGWLYAVLAFLGFVNGLVPWTFRNFQAFGDVIPIVDTAYLHLWVGNHREADGGPVDPIDIPARLAKNLEDLDYIDDPAGEPEDLASLRRTLRRHGDKGHLPGVTKAIGEWKRTPQNERYNLLAGVVVGNIQRDPAGAMKRRILAGLCFVFGSRWAAPDAYIHRGKVYREGPRLGSSENGFSAVILASTLFALLILAVLGWRWTYPFQKGSMPLSLALIWVPLPYLLTHGEALSGPRLPLDGVLLCYAAFALACLVPGFGRDLFRGPELRAE